jgi:hypothetical protein
MNITNKIPFTYKPIAMVDCIFVSDDFRVLKRLECYSFFKNAHVFPFPRDLNDTGKIM